MQNSAILGFVTFIDLQRAFDNVDRELLYYCLPNNFLYGKELVPLTAKLALLLIKFMKYGIVQFLSYEYFEESPSNVYIPNICC